MPHLCSTPYCAVSDRLLGQMPPPSYHTSTARRRQHSSAQLYSANNSGDEEDLPNAALAAPISVVNGEDVD